MIRPVVYVESTIPSFYHEIRKDHTSLTFREWTREWWDNHRSKYRLVTSGAVLDELTSGDYPTKDEVLDLMREVPVLPFEDEVVEIASYYIQHRVMPDDPTGDAMHLATASYHKCDFLVTWNCRHLANANKFPRIREINAILGLFTPALVTPLELLGAPDEA